jgi:galactitol-specific phosphotransferase system IIC component
VDLRVQTRAVKAVNGGFNLELVVGFKIDGAVQEEKAQTLTLSLVPDTILKLGPIPTNKLIDGIEAISEAVAKAANKLPGFHLNNARVELDFALQKDGSGNISFVVEAGGSVSKDNSNAIAITLVPA